jgi:hypothetical protein
MSTSDILRRGASRLGGGLAAILIAGAVLWPQVGSAHSGSPFAEFSGSWKGAGQVVGVNGNAEKIRCRADYSTSASGESLTQSLVCASDSYRIDVKSFVIAGADGVEGHWEEATRKVTGHLTGKVADGQFDGSISGTGFTAEMSLKTAGRKQTLSIKPQGGDIAKVEIVLARDS